MKQLILKWLGINQSAMTFSEFLERWHSFRSKGTGIGIDGEEYPPTFENWMAEEIERENEKNPKKEK